MPTDHHAFIDGDVGLCGAILRREEPGRLRTRTVFRMGVDAPVYLVDHVVDHDGDVRQWTRFQYDSPTSGIGHVGTRDPDGAVRVDGTPVPALSGAVGGYGEHLVVEQVLRDGRDAVSYLQLDEGAPDDRPEPAWLRRTGRESTELMDGSHVEAERVRLVVAGRATNTHWCVDGAVVKSDWCGAQSFLVDDLEALCAGVDPEVAVHIRDFVALESG